MLDQKEAIPFLSPDRERLLEYDISRAISRVMTTDKPVVGVMSPLPYAGQQMNPMMARMGGGRGTPPWAIYSELKSDYNVKTVEMTADKIPDDVKVLVRHPSQGDLRHGAVRDRPVRAARRQAHRVPRSASACSTAARPADRWG